MGRFMLFFKILKHPTNHPPKTTILAKIRVIKYVILDAAIKHKFLLFHYNHLGILLNSYIVQIIFEPKTQFRTAKDVLNKN